MNNLITNFEQVLAMAKEYGLPIEKKRGILREYLQSKFLVYFYGLPASQKMSFVGGTSLRLLRGLDRFSEDLDFDNLGLNDEEVGELVESVAINFEKENIKIELKKNGSEGKTYFDLRFPELLNELKISTDPREKLMIKFDYAKLWKEQMIEPILFNRYDMIVAVVTNNLNQIVVQKLAAYVGRKITQPRDIYDIVWLYAKGARIDKQFAKANGYANIVELAVEKQRQEGELASYETKLKPFLFTDGSSGKLKLFEDVLRRIRVK